MPLAYDPSYSPANTGALRKPPPTVGAPSLVQHLAFWIPKGVKKSDWHRSVDHFLFRLHQYLHQKFRLDLDRYGHTLRPHLFSCANIDENNRLWLLWHYVDLNSIINPSIANIVDAPLQERSVRYEVFTLHTVFYGFDLTIRADLRNELWSITFIADLSCHYNLSPQTYTSDKFGDAFRTITGLFSDESRDDLSEFQSSKSSSLYESLSDTLFQEYYGFINENIILRCEEQLDGGLVGVGGMIADFRGVILGLAFKKGTSRFEPKSFDELAAKQGMRRQMHSRLNYAVFDNELSLQVMDTIWPLVRSAFRGLSMFSKSELTASRFIDNGAIYITSLGRFTSGVSANIRDPVRYILIVNYPSRWQIGRLVDRINSMGVARISSLYDMVALQAASDRLRELSTEWRNANDAGASGAFPLVDARSYAAQLEALNNAVDSGLLNRIERSSYYVDNLYELVEGMRGQRIEGFQVYKDFVDRRQRGTFEFIARIGVRYAGLRREIMFALDNQRTDNLVSLVRTISSLETDIRQILINQEKEQSSFNLNLERAEIFLSFGIIYYLGTVGYEAFCDVSNYINKTPSEFGLSRVLSFIVVAVGCAFYFYWRRRKFFARIAALAKTSLGQKRPVDLPK